MCGDLNIKLADFGMAVKLRDQPEEMDDMLCGTPSCKYLLHHQGLVLFLYDQKLTAWWNE